MTNKTKINLYEQISLIRKTLADHSEGLDFLAQSMVQHEEQLVMIKENMATKEDIGQLNQTLDMLVKSNNDIKEDHIFGLRWQKRMQEQLDFHEGDLKRLKLVLKLV